jgi:cytidylate kinase
MKLIPHLEKAEAYLNVHLSRSGPGLPAQPVLPFVTISREAGAGASSLARLLADNLNSFLSPGDPPWTVFDGNLVEAMLEAHHYSKTLAQFLPEDDVSEVRSSVGELVGLHPSLWDLTQKTNELIRRLARLGHCILIGRGANFATAGLKQGVHLRLIGSPESRALHVASLLRMSIEDATARNMRADVARRRYVRQTFGRDIDDPAFYDLVINTDKVVLPEASRMIAAVLRTRQPVHV